MSKQSIRYFVAALWMLVISANFEVALSETLYSVGGGNLVTINPTDGTVRLVGPIKLTPPERSLADTDLAGYGGVIWVSDSHFQGGSSPFTDLFALSPNSGAVLCETRLSYNGLMIYSEGFTVLGQRLTIAFDAPDPLVTGASNIVGDASVVTGAITNPRPLAADSCTAGSEGDVDGLGVDAEGRMIGTDAFSGPVQRYTELHAIPSNACLKSYGSPADPTGLHDIVLANGALLATDIWTRRIHTIDPVTLQIVTSVGLQPPLVEYLGIAAMGSRSSMFTLSVTQADGQSLLSWDALSTASNYTAIKGSLLALRQTGGAFDVSATACLGARVLGTSLEDTAIPAPGDGFWYLVRANPCGTYDSGLPSQVGTRDPEIWLSGVVCE